MSLEQQQAVLARLLTDATFRQRWLKNPHALDPSTGLSPDEHHLLSSLPAELLTYQAQALLNKRRQELQKLLPLTFRGLGENARTLHAHFAETYLPTGLTPHRTEALQFAHWLRQHTQQDRPLHPELGELARYEAALLAGYEPGRWGGLHHFALHLQDWKQGLEAGQSVAQLRHSIRPGKTLLLWMRLGQHGILRRWLISSRRP